jgi:hypothetical protein
MSAAGGQAARRTAVGAGTFHRAGQRAVSGRPAVCLAKDSIHNISGLMPGMALEKSGKTLEKNGGYGGKTAK